MPSREFVKQAYELVPSNGNVLIHYVRNAKATCVEDWQALQLASTASRHKKTHGFRERSGCVPQSGSRHNEFRSRSKITFSCFPFMFVFVFGQKKFGQTKGKFCHKWQHLWLLAHPIKFWQFFKNSLFGRFNEPIKVVSRRPCPTVPWEPEAGWGLYFRLFKKYFEKVIICFISLKYLKMEYFESQK